MDFFLLPVRRPVAIMMLFTGIMLLGVVAWQKMPVELFPELVGNQVSIEFYRPGSEPEVLEREILLPLQAQVSTISGVSETWGEIIGTSGQFDVQFESGVNIKVREFELQRIITELQRNQPRGTWLNLRTSGTGSFSDLAMTINVLGSSNYDKDALYDLVEQIVAPRFASISGVSQAQATGGARQQVTVTVDPDRTAALGFTTKAVTDMVQRTVGRMKFVGGLEDETGRTAVILDGRPISIHALANSRIAMDRPALLGHVSDVAIGMGREERLFRVNGQPAVGMVIFKEQGTNLIRLGSTLRDRVEEIREELNPQGLDLVIGFDAAEAVDDQIRHLSKLGISGFTIALIVLFFFLRQWRAVAVVGIAVPVSLCAALSMLFVAGQTLNLVSLFGLMLVIGLVVDNSVVVFEAIKRRLELGLTIENAVYRGLRRTVRAILATSATTAVVFLPLAVVDLDDESTRQLAQVVSISILLPLAASLLVAIGLVPLLAHRLAAPAAKQILVEARRRRSERGNSQPPDQARMILSGTVASALRHPPTLIAGTLAAILITVIIALPWVMANNQAQSAAEPDQIQLSARFPSDRSIRVASDAIARLENTVLKIPEVESLEAIIELDGGSLTINFIDRELRPETFKVQNVRNSLRKEAGKIKGLEILRPGEGRDARGKNSADDIQGVFGGAPAEIVLSGPDSRVLLDLAENIEAQLGSMPQIVAAWTTTQSGLSEYWVEPDQVTFESLGLNFNQVLPALRLAGQEGERLPVGFVLQSGRELPLVVERKSAREENVGMSELTRLRIQTPAGILPVTSLATMRQMPPPAVISHHNGRREMSVMYRLREDIPETGPTRILVEDQIAESIRSIPRPQGTTISTDDPDDTTTWLRKVGVPAAGLLFLVLAMTFESLTLPILVLIAVPLTLLGAVWALAFAGISFSIMAALGAVVLTGLSVNPAILLVDRMQQLIRQGWSLGAAAFAAVRERTRPILMTSATTIAGLWPLAITTGRENEIWPPFATIVIGGLITSSLLTLLMIPVGFILLKKVDQIFNRVGPWLVLAWMGDTGAVMASLILTDIVNTLLWQSVLTLLTASGLLAMVVLVFRPREIPEPDCTDGPPRLEVRFLHKTYGLPGTLKTALMAPSVYTRKVLESGGNAFLAADAKDRLVPLALGIAGICTIAYLVQTPFWQLFFWLLAGLLLSKFILNAGRVLGHADNTTGAIESGRLENKIIAVIPWLVISIFTSVFAIKPHLEGSALPGMYVLCLLAALFLAVLQGMRRSARLQANGELSNRVSSEGLGSLVNLWRSWSAQFAGLDLPINPVHALAGVNFSVERGMIGILGPNGAGKTTLLRQLAGVLDPTRGTILYGGVHLNKIQRYLARWVGYLPQDAGLPEGMSPREYLTWYAALYNIPTNIRTQRVNELLEETGLSEKTDDKIKSLSGGMRQRVAVARTLLRLPPVIIVDEPTVGLDPRERIRFRTLLSRLARDRIVLISTHVVEDVAIACDRVLVISEGHLVFDGGTDALADSATGRVWEMRTKADEKIALPEGSIRTHETPAADGSIVHRIIATGKPGDAAKLLQSTLEDGYMWLISGKNGARRISA